MLVCCVCLFYLCCSYLWERQPTALALHTVSTHKLNFTPQMKLISLIHFYLLFEIKKSCLTTVYTESIMIVIYR